MPQERRQLSIPVRDYNLAETLRSGQAFRWRQVGACWEGVIGSHWVSLRSERGMILAETAEAPPDWGWLRHYLQVDVNLAEVRQTFPDDPTMRLSLAACPGLRLLRQEPWECLASFVLSANKQIVQIQQVISELCRRFGRPVPVPKEHEPAFSFPRPERLAATTEAELRSCKMGYRAPHLLAVSRLVAEGAVPLERIGQQPVEAARAALVALPGVGPKIADCVLLFAYGFPAVFPVDVWILKALRHLYFPRARPTPARLRQFAAGYFGPQAGYAQQYLFHYVRTAARARSLVFTGQQAAKGLAASSATRQSGSRPAQQPASHRS